jgi:hypothetical protein
LEQLFKKLLPLPQHILEGLGEELQDSIHLSEEQDLILDSVLEGQMLELFQEDLVLQLLHMELIMEQELEELAWVLLL